MGSAFAADLGFEVARRKVFAGLGPGVALRKPGLRSYQHFRNMTFGIGPFVQESSRTTGDILASHIRHAITNSRATQSNHHQSKRTYIATCTFSKHIPCS